ncbi:hypothetical protein ABZS79_30595 [Streptomyces griseoloalbus]|uniref:hypothetical protein n=1 Tax=Streptomyces griseoloalbus TaxID=67303 RepID=UPI0033BB491F
MAMRRGQLRWLVVLLVPLLLAGGGIAFWQSRQSDTRLAVTIEGLPGAARPSVTVTGPGGFERTVTASTILTVPAGRLRVTPAPVKADRATYYTAREVLTATVARGERERLSVDYQVAVADRTQILDPADTGLARTTGGADRDLLFQAGASLAQKLKAGDILLAAEGPRTPKGLLRRVVAVEERASGITVRTAPARLRDAMPKAVLRFLPADEREAAGSDIVPAAHTQEPPFPESETAFRVDAQRWKAGPGTASCGTNFPVLKAEGKWPGIDFTGTDMGFDRTDLVWARLQARIAYALKTTWGTPHSAHCSWEWEGDLDKTHLASSMVAVLARVGPFTVRPELATVGGVEVQAATGLKLESRVENDFTVTSRLSLRPFASARIEDKTPAVYESRMAGATAGKLKGKIGFRVKLVAAAPLDVFASAFTLEFATGVEGSVEPLDRKAKVEGFIEGTAAMEMTAGGFKGRQIGMTIPVYKTPLWERALPPALAYATADAVEIRTGQASPDRISPIPAGTAAHQLLWSPDGTRLAWTTRPTSPGPGSRVYLADLTTGKVGDWECPDCRVSFAGDQLLSEWNSLDGEEKGLARYRVGRPEPDEAPLGNPGVLHRGQTEDERLEVAKRYCGSGGCATIGLYGESGKSGQPLVGINWNDCRVRLFRVDSRLRAAPFTVATPNRGSVTEPGPDGRLLVAGWDIGDGCDDETPPMLKLSELSEDGRSDSAPIPSRYASWEACHLFYDEKRTPHAVLAPPMDDGDVLTSEYPCFQQPAGAFRTLSLRGDSWKETRDGVLLRRARDDWSADLRTGGRLTAAHAGQSFLVADGVRTFAWGPGAS